MANSDYRTNTPARGRTSCGKPSISTSYKGPNVGKKETPKGGSAQTDSRVQSNYKRGGR